MRFKYKFGMVAMSLLLLVTLFLSVTLGAVPVSLQEIYQILLGSGADTHRMVLLNLRLPRVLEAAVVGMGLSVVGTVFQGLLRNPMADPFVLGVSSGAAFGATLAIILGFGMWGTGFAAFAAALTTIFAVYNVARSGLRVSVTTMLLAGVAISALMSSIISLLMLLNHQDLSRIVFWTMGSFAFVVWEQVWISSAVIFVGALVLYTYARDINAIITGEEVAEHLGVDTERVKKVTITLGSLLTATAVAMCGIIGFVGLIIPHIARLLVGPDNRVLIPFSALTGGIFLVWADTLARVVLKPAELPVGIITAALGGPFFLYLLMKDKKKIERM